MNRLNQLLPAEPIRGSSNASVDIGCQCQTGHITPSSRPLTDEASMVPFRSLRWPDVDFDGRLIRVRGTLTRVDGELRVTPPKSDKSRRSIPTSARALAVLRDVHSRTEAERNTARQLWVNTGFVFVTDVGEPCDPRNALRALTAAARAAGLTGSGCTPCGTPRRR